MSAAAEVAVIGGGLGGVAAALAALDAGRTVLLTEDSDWLGGQPPPRRSRRRAPVDRAVRVHGEVPAAA